MSKERSLFRSIVKHRRNASAVLLLTAGISIAATSEVTARATPPISSHISALEGQRLIGALGNINHGRSAITHCFYLKKEFPPPTGKLLSNLTLNRVTTTDCIPVFGEDDPQQALLDVQEATPALQQYTKEVASDISILTDNLANDCYFLPQTAQPRLGDYDTEISQFDTISNSIRKHLGWSYKKQPQLKLPRGFMGRVAFQGTSS